MLVVRCLRDRGDFCEPVQLYNKYLIFLSPHNNQYLFFGYIIPYIILFMICNKGFN